MGVGAFMLFAATPVSFNFTGRIMPKPKEAEYLDEDVVLFEGGRWRTCVVVGEGASRPELTAVEEVASRLASLAGEEGGPRIVKPDGAAGFPVAIAIGTASSNSLCSRALREAGLSPPDHPEGYALTFLDSWRGLIVCVAGSSPKGAYFGAQSLKQLAHAGGGKVLLRLAKVRDWPTFEWRGSNCYTVEWLEWLAFCKFNSFDVNYSAHGIDGWRDPDRGGLPRGWGLYLGAGAAKIGSSQEVRRSGRRSVYIEITGFYPSFGGRPDFLNVALMQGDSDGYWGDRAYRAEPGRYEFSLWLRGDVPKVAVYALGWRGEEASPATRVDLGRPVEFKPSSDWRPCRGTFSVPKGVRRFALKIALYGWREEGFEVGQRVYVDDVVIRRAGTEGNLAENPGGEEVCFPYRERIRSLCEAASERGLDVTQFVNPLWTAGWEFDGLDKITISDERDILDLAGTFAISLKAGARRAMLCLDDFSSKLGGPAPWYVITNPKDRRHFKSLGEAHGHLARRLYEELRKIRPDVQLLVCPAYYWLPRGAYKAEGERYLREFGRLAPEEALVVWTGPVVRSRVIRREDFERYASLVGRKALYLWDNTIYARHSPPLYLLDPFDTVYPERFWEVTPGVHNNGGSGEVYKVGALCFAERLWNPEGYDPEEALRTAIEMVAGKEAVGPLLRFRDAFYVLWDRFNFLRSPERLGRAVGWLDEGAYRGLTGMLDALERALREARESCPNEALISEIERRAQEFLRARPHLKRLLKPDEEGKVWLSPFSFEGGVGPQWYEHECPGRVAVWIYGRRTRWHTMKATFRLEGAPAGRAMLIVEGQDDDKPGRTGIRIALNGMTLFEGENPFPERGWAERRFEIPPGTLRAGENRLVIENLEDSEATNADWFMLSSARVEWESR